MKAEHSADPVRALLVAALPGVLVLLACHGGGLLLNLASTAAGSALALMSLAPGGRGDPVARWREARGRRGAWIAALLLALSLPPQAPVWLGAAGGVLAVAATLAPRHLGITLNPAMTALVVLLLLFPLPMSRWPLAGGEPASLLETLQAALGLLPVERLDALTGATALEVLRTDTARTVAELRAAEPVFGSWGARGIEWANAAFLAGGLWLVRRGTVAWRLPAGMLGTLAVLALLGNDGGSSASRGPALFHLFSGGIMLGAFFVLTEPRGAPRTPLGQWLGGALAGGLVYAMRTGGGWPDGIAFAVLAVNALVPLLDLAPVASAQRRAGLAVRALVLAVLAFVLWHEAPSRESPLPDPGVWLRTLGVPDGAALGVFTVQDPGRLGLGEPETAYRAIHAGRVVAVVLPLRAREGYGGPIHLWLAVDSQGQVLGVRVLSHRESPQFVEPQLSAPGGWTAAFTELGLADARWRLRAEGGSFDGFTGASITPRAVIAGIEGGLQYFGENRENLLDPAR